MIDEKELIEKIEKEIDGIIVKDTYSKGKNAGLRKARILTEEQSEIGGWISCSERLPENISTVIVQVKEIEKPTFGWYEDAEKKWALSEKDFIDLDKFTVIAWQPMPEKYQ